MVEVFVGIGTPLLPSRSLSRQGVLEVVFGAVLVILASKQLSVSYDLPRHRARSDCPDVGQQQVGVEPAALARKRPHSQFARCKRPICSSCETEFDRVLVVPTSEHNSNRFSCPRPMLAGQEMKYLAADDILPRA